MKEEVSPGFYTLGGTGQPPVEVKPRDAGAARPAQRCGALALGLLFLC